MKLSERRYCLTMSKIRDFLLNSNVELGQTIHADRIPKSIQDISEEEIKGAIRHLMGKGYLAPCEKNDEFTLERVKLTSRGLEEWIFPEGYDNQRRIFLSHASEDKEFAGIIKTKLEKLDFEVFIAHDDIPGTFEWRDKIITELSTCGIFIALRTKKYNGKTYTEQECGFALAQKKRVLSLFIETNPKKAGFCEVFQGGKFKKAEIEKIIQYCTKQLN